MFVTHGNLRDSVAIATSLLLIVLASVLLGTALPFALVKAGVDPAHAGSSIQVRVGKVHQTCHDRLCRLQGSCDDAQRLYNRPQASSPVVNGSSVSSYNATQHLSLPEMVFNRQRRVLSLVRCVHLIRYWQSFASCDGEAGERHEGSVSAA